MEEVEKVRVSESGLSDLWRWGRGKKKTRKNVHGEKLTAVNIFEVIADLLSKEAIYKKKKDTNPLSF